MSAGSWAECCRRSSLLAPPLLDGASKCGGCRVCSHQMMGECTSLWQVGSVQSVETLMSPAWRCCLRRESSYRTLRGCSILDYFDGCWWISWLMVAPLAMLCV